MANSFAKGLEKLEDLSPGLKIPGRITNVTAFGAFVDVGVHQDGLIHLSEMADHYVRTPTDVVRLGQEVMVTVLGVDVTRNRLSLSLKSAPRVKKASLVVESSKGPGSKGQGPLRKPQPPKGPFNNPFAALKNFHLCNWV